MIVSDTAFTYLIHQAGDINDLSHDRATWEVAYRAKLQAQFDNIRPHLPSWCNAVLDVGSGLGGIGVLLNRHYGCGVRICLLDGDNRAPVPAAHAQPHNSMDAAREFLAANGVRRVYTRSPQATKPFPAGLIVSFAAWCFHIPPTAYLDYIASCCNPGTVLVLDVRRGKPEWERELAGWLDARAVILEARKFRRMVFAGRG